MPLNDRASELAKSDLPRERLKRTGIESLSLGELIALMLGTGTRGCDVMQLSEKVLERIAGTRSEREFYRSIPFLKPAILAGIKGLGAVKRQRLEVVVELINRGQKLAPTKPDKHVIPPNLRNARKEWIGFIPFFEKTRGELVVIEKGVRTHVNFDPIELFAPLLNLRPSGFKLFHNHPSGNPTPSEADLELTRHVAQVSEMLGIDFLGHWIVTTQKTTQIK